MKYFYSKKFFDGYEKMSVGRNLDSVKEDPNKLVIINDDSVYYALTYRNPLLEEKKVLDYPELVDYIKNSRLNVYFFNMDKELSRRILVEVSDKKEKNKTESSILKEDIYTIKDDRIIKFKAFVDRKIVRSAIQELFDKEKAKADFYERMNKTENEFKKTPFKSLVKDPTILENYNLPLFVSNDECVVSTYDHMPSNIFNLLNDIYSKLGDKINLSEKNLRELYLLTNSNYKNIVDEIINSIEVKQEERYNLEIFENSIDYIENEKMKDNFDASQLNIIKKYLEEAKNNEEMINNLGILNKKEVKLLEKRK